MQHNKFKVTYSNTDKILLVGCISIGAIVFIVLDVISEYLLASICSIVALLLSGIGILDTLLFYVKVEESVIRVRNIFGRKYEFSCEDIEEVVCTKSKSVGAGPILHIELLTQNGTVQVEGKMAGFQQMAEYLLKKYENGEIKQTAIGVKDLNALDQFSTRRFYSKKRRNKHIEQIDGTLCQTRLIVKSIDDKEKLKAVCPIFIWGATWMISLIAVARLPYPLITVPIFLIIGFSVIPIAIICVKKGIKFRKKSPFELEAIFITSGTTVSMNGKKVTITVDGTTDKFFVMIDRWSGYEVENSEEFASFLRKNNIPCDIGFVKIV